MDYSLKLANAVSNNHLETVKHLIEENRVPDEKKIVRLAAEKGSLDILRYLDEKNSTLADWNRREFDSLATHTAIEFAQFPTLKYFIEDKKVDVDIINEYGEPPIFTALRCNKIDIFKYLVNKNANLTATDDRGNNILFWISKIDDVSLARYILDEKKVPIDINWRNKVGDTVLHHAVLAVGSKQYGTKLFNWRKDIPLIEYLVKEKHADVNAVGNHGKTPLHAAALLAHLKICNLLMDYGADVKLKDGAGYSYWDILSLNKKGIRRRRSVPSRFEEKSTPALRDWTDRVQYYDNNFHINHVTEDAVIALPYNSDPPRWNVSYLATIVQFLLKYSKGSYRAPAADRFTFSSPADILRERVDPVAVDVVMYKRNF